MSDDCGCTGDEARAKVDPRYRRALWIVVVLNIGFGIAELAGGFFTGSQALQADSLDFIGDGSITLVGLLALGWSALTRARIAFGQGLFLGALGLGVIGAAAIIQHASAEFGKNQHHHLFRTVVVSQVLKEVADRNREIRKQHSVILQLVGVSVVAALTCIKDSGAQASDMDSSHVPQVFGYRCVCIFDLRRVLDRCHPKDISTFKDVLTRL